MNLKAIRIGYESVDTRFKFLECTNGDYMILSGSKAVGLGALAAGLKFYSAYPMSPSTPVMEFLSSKSVEAGIVVEQAEDEIVGINMAIGASFAGARAMTGTSVGSKDRYESNTKINTGICIKNFLSNIFYVKSGLLYYDVIAFE